ncbi:MAG: hypothetical protein SF339_26445 [Blastocatellia bacterium]|nr:hypothetical protein [Blastocatellia bacterium]
MKHLNCLLFLALLGAASLPGQAAVCPATTMAPEGLPVGTVGVPYRQTITIQGDTGTHRIDLVSGKLPAGIRFERDASLTGTPLGPAGARLVFWATNINTGCLTKKEYVLEINDPPACPTLTVAPQTLPEGRTGAPFNHTVAVSGGTAPYIFRINIRSNFPPGVSFFGGVFSGTATQAGTYAFGGTVVDAKGCEGSWGYTVTIRPGVTAVSAASYRAGAAPESIIAAFGPQLAAQTQAAAAMPLPTALGGVQARIRDSLGVEHATPLFFVSPGQVNLQIPATVAIGSATISFNNGAAGQLEIARVSPGLFTANADGQGVPAAVLLRVNNGAQRYEPIARLENGRYAPLPIQLTSSTEQVFLVLFGTGLRYRGTVTATAGGLDAPVLFAGAAAGFAGLDQINIRLPYSLRGRGDVDVVVQADRAPANTVRIRVQ